MRTENYELHNETALVQFVVMKGALPKYVQTRINRCRMRFFRSFVHWALVVSPCCCVSWLVLHAQPRLGCEIKSRQGERNEESTTTWQDYNTMDTHLDKEQVCSTQSRVKLVMLGGKARTLNAVSSIAQCRDIAMLMGQEMNTFLAQHNAKDWILQDEEVGSSDSEDEASPDSHHLTLSFDDDSASHDAESDDDLRQISFFSPRRDEPVHTTSRDHSGRSYAPQQSVLRYDSAAVQPRRDEPVHTTSRDHSGRSYAPQQSNNTLTLTLHDSAAVQQREYSAMPVIITSVSSLHLFDAHACLSLLA